MNLDAWIGRRREQVDAWLAAWVAGSEGPEPLRRAMAYSLESGGKRLRPLLALAAAEACGAADVPPPLADFCCALELIHTYSLVHDDLPILDDDDLRRGRPTSHRVFGEPLALLAGDGLLTEAFHLLAGGEPGEAPVRLALVRRLAAAAGSGGMVGGQVMDVQRLAFEAGLEAVETVHRLKTGALITCACAGGGEAIGAGAGPVGALERFGAAAGLAFQIVDDLLDEEGDPKRMGKAARKDADRDVATVPRAIGVEASRARARALEAQALAALEALGSAEALRGLAGRLVEREA